MTLGITSHTGNEIDFPFFINFAGPKGTGGLPSKKGGGKKGGSKKGGSKKGGSKKGGAKKR